MTAVRTLAHRIGGGPATGFRAGTACSKVVTERAGGRGTVGSGSPLPDVDLRAG